MGSEKTDSLVYRDWFVLCCVRRSIDSITSMLHDDSFKLSRRTSHESANPPMDEFPGNQSRGRMVAGVASWTGRPQRGVAGGVRDAKATAAALLSASTPKITDTAHPPSSSRPGDPNRSGAARATGEVEPWSTPRSDARRHSWTPRALSKPAGSAPTLWHSCASRMLDLGRPESPPIVLSPAGPSVGFIVF